MLTLFHHPFCPHSHFIRLALGEYALDPDLAEERAWERREEFLLLNPAGHTPVLVAEGYPAIPGAGVIAEYLAEQYGPTEDGTGVDLLGKEFPNGSRCGGCLPGSTRSSSPKSRIHW